MIKKILISVLSLLLVYVSNGQIIPRGTPNYTPQGNANTTTGIVGTIQAGVGFIDGLYDDTLHANLLSQNIWKIPFYNIATRNPIAKWYRDTTINAWIKVGTGSSGGNTIYTGNGSLNSARNVNGNNNSILWSNIKGWDVEDYSNSAMTGIIMQTNSGAGLLFENGAQGNALGLESNGTTVLTSSSDSSIFLNSGKDINSNTSGNFNVTSVNGNLNVTTKGINLTTINGDISENASGGIGLSSSTGVINLTTNGSNDIQLASANSISMSLSQPLLINGDDGTDGYVFTSHGLGTPPTWSPVSGGSLGLQDVINNNNLLNIDNEINSENHDFKIDSIKNLEFDALQGMVINTGNNINITSSDGGVAINANGGGAFVVNAATGIVLTAVGSSSVQVTSGDDITLSSQNGVTIGGIGNDYSLPNTDGTSGQVLTTDGNHNVTWQNPSVTNYWVLDSLGNITANNSGDVISNNNIIGDEVFGNSRGNGLLDDGTVIGSGYNFLQSGGIAGVDNQFARLELGSLNYMPNTTITFLMPNAPTNNYIPISVNGNFADTAGNVIVPTGTTYSGTGYLKLSGTTPSYVTSIPNSDLAHSSITLSSPFGLTYSGSGVVALGNTLTVTPDTTSLSSLFALKDSSNALRTLINTKGSGTVSNLHDSTTNGVDITWVNRTTTPAPIVVLNNITPTSISTNSVNLLRQFSATPPPAHGNTLLDSAGLGWRDSTGRTIFLNKSLLAAGAMRIDSFQNASGKIALVGDTTGGTGLGTQATPFYVNSQSFLKNITGLVTAGTNIILGGAGMGASPYAVNADTTTGTSKLATQGFVTRNWSLSPSNICVGLQSYKVPPQITYAHEEPIEILNIGNNASSIDSANYVNTGFTKNNWAMIEVWNMKYDTTAKTFSSPVISKPSLALEVGLEGVTMHAVVPGKSFSSTWHEQFQARGTGLDGNTGISSGNYLQAKCPLFFEYQGNSTYGGDSDPWTGGSATGGLPFIWMQSNEAKFPAGEYVRFEQNNAGATGGQMLFRKSRGTYITKTASLQNDNAGVVTFSIYDGTNYQNTARILPFADTLATAGIAPQSVTIQTSATDSLSFKTRIRFFGNGVVNIGSNVFSATGTARFTVNGTALIIDSLGNFSRYNNSAITNGQLLIGNTSTGIFNKATLTAGVGQSITNGGGTVTLASLLQYPHNITTPTTGGTVNLTNNQYNIINPAGALLALTVNLPSSPVNNDVVYIKFTQNITTVSYANGTVVDGITAPTAGGLTVLTYDGSSSSWY